MNFDIQHIDETLRPEIQDKIDNLNKPKGSLGRLESLALQICQIQQTLTPSLSHPCHLLFGGDHGIEREGVSVSPREVTWQQMVNFTRGGGGVNMFCRQHGFDLKIIDAGVDYDLTPYPTIINRKIARGTRNFLYEPAMTAEEFERALSVGAEMVDECHQQGCRILSIGEMGIGNTSPSSLNSDGIRHKFEILSKAITNYKSHLSPLLYFGGFEMVAAIGAMLRAAELRLVILVDGFIMTACALAATTLNANASDYMIFTHCGDESGHKRLLDAMHAEPLLHLGLRLGEGTGALCAFPIVDSAVRMINEMNNFNNAHITKYF